MEMLQPILHLPTMVLKTGEILICLGIPMSTSPGGFETPLEFDTTVADEISSARFVKSWSDSVDTGAGTFRLAKLTLSEDANGSFVADAFDAESGDTGGRKIVGVIIDGRIRVDSEPDTDTPTENADFTYDNSVSGADFLAWQRGFGYQVEALRHDGDANNDQIVDHVDLQLWQSAVRYWCRRHKRPGSTPAPAFCNFARGFLDLYG